MENIQTDAEKQKRLEALHALLGEEEDTKEDDDKKEEGEAEEAEEDGDEDQKEKAEKNESYQEHLGALFEGEELTAAAQEKIATLFEAAVGYETDKKAAEIYKRLNEEKEQAIDEAKRELHEQADEYLGYVVEEWSKKNEVALKQQIKVNLMESFISGLRNLFLEHNFNIPEDKCEMIDSLMERQTELENSIKDLSRKNAKLSEELDAAERKIAFHEVSEGMTALDVEKLTNLVEGKTYADAEEFRKAATLIKESYFKEKKVEEEPVIAESTKDDTMAQYLAFMNRSTR